MGEWVSMSRIVKTLLAQKWGPISMLQGRKMGANFRQKHQRAIFSTLAPISKKLMGKRGIERPAPNCLASSSVQIRAKFPVGAPKIPNPPISFQILDFGLRILGFGFVILDFWFWMLGFGFRILDWFSLQSWFGSPKWARLDFGSWICNFKSRRLGSAVYKSFALSSGLLGLSTLFF